MSYDNGHGSHEDGRGDSIVGLSVGDAVDEIVGGDDARDPEAVRATLDRVATDGAVSRDGVDEALAEASKVVSTAETRAELAGIALSDARDEAGPVSDLDSVAARLDAFASRLESVERRAADLGADLETLVGGGGDDDTVYAVATGIRRLTATATEVQQTADELKLDLESFERWLGSPAVRFRELGDDADAVERSLDELAAAPGRLAAADERDPDGEGVEPAAAGATWADARLRHRMLSLVLADVRAELADLRTWADGDDVNDGRLDELEARLTDLDARLAATGDRLDDIARPEWTDRFGDRVAAFAAATDDFEPPLD